MSAQERPPSAVDRIATAHARVHAAQIALALTDDPDARWEALRLLEVAMADLDHLHEQLTGEPCP